MKKSMMTIGTLLLTGSMAVSAGPHQPRFEDSAKVMDVEPIYEMVRVQHPEQVCWDEDVSYTEPRATNFTGTVLGGVIGGTLVNQLHRGHGKGKDAATLAGALLGGAIGHDLSQRTAYAHQRTATERVCEMRTTTRQEEQLVGYRVKYRYKGHIFTTRMDEYPGKRIPVQVSVAPMDAY